jgi:hypothetical protein
MRGPPRCPPEAREATPHPRRRARLGHRKDGDPVPSHAFIDSVLANPKWAICSPVGSCTRPYTPSETDTAAPIAAAITRGVLAPLRSLRVAVSLSLDIVCIGRA